MFISINRVGDSITGSYGDTTFGVAYNKKRWDTMSKLAEKANNAKKPAELTKIYDEFAKLTVDNLKDTVETECPNVFVNGKGKFYLKVGKKISSVEMPPALVDRIKDTLDKGLDATPIIKFWTRWLRNPILRKKSPAEQIDFSTRMFNYVNAMYVDTAKANKMVHEDGVTEEIANERSSVYQVKITNEGLLCTYKVSRELTEKYALDDDGQKKVVPRYKPQIDENIGIISYDEPKFVEDRLFEPAVQGRGGDAFYCEGKNGFDKPDHFIRVGCTHRLPDWNMVNTSNDSVCVKGLHVGGLSYIKGYQNEGTVTHNVFVDPMHVGAIPRPNHTGDAGDTAIRCIQYFVHSSFAGVNGSIYHSSSYAEQTDKQWDEMRTEILDQFGEYKKEVDEAAEEAKSL